MQTPVLEIVLMVPATVIMNSISEIIDPVKSWQNCSQSCDWTLWL